MTRFWTFHVRVSWSLLFDALFVYFLSDVWETLHDDPVSLNRRCCTVCDKRCHYQIAYGRNQFTEPVIAKNSKAISLLNGVLVQPAQFDEPYSFEQRNLGRTATIALESTLQCNKNKLTLLWMRLREWYHSLSCLRDCQVSHGLFSIIGTF